MKALIISNPKSGTSETMLGEVIGSIESRYDELVIKKTSEKGSATRYAEESRHFDHLIVIGGDGTLNEVVCGVMTLSPGDRPIIGIIPGGTCNDFARALDLPMNPARAARTINKEQVKRVDVIKINDRYALNFIGVGLIADTSKEIDPEEKDKLGSVGYFLATIRQFRETEPFFIRLSRRGEVLHEGEVSFLYVGNGSYLGSVPTKLDTQSFSDGLLEVVHSSAIGFPMIRLLLEQRLGLDQSSSEWMHMQTNELEVQLADSQVIDVDGEHFEAKALKIEVLESAMSFFIP